ncbi:MAG: hypothetical protein HZB56_06205 [Deltaproteobacteria bacterium]|nr:hypothetical protein [Deltaproteobacteria bacterium]
MRRSAARHRASGLDPADPDPDPGPDPDPDPDLDADPDPGRVHVPDRAHRRAGACR